MVGNRHGEFTDVVFVVRFEQLVIHARMARIRARKGDRFAGQWNESWVHRDADDVVARRDVRLAVAAVEHEVLAAEEEPIRVGPSGADALIAWHADGAAAAELRIARRLPEIRRVRIGVEHAESAFGGAPDEPGGGI